MRNLHTISITALITFIIIVSCQRSTHSNKRGKQDLPDSAQIAQLKEEGYMLYEKGNYVESIKQLSEVLSYDSLALGAYFIIGMCYDELGDDLKAIDYYTLGELKGFKYNWLYNNRGNSYSKIGEYEKAIADHGRAIERDPNEGVHYINRGSVWFRAGDLIRAEKDYLKGIEKGAQEAYAYNNLAEVRALKGDPFSILINETEFHKSNPLDSEKLIYLYLLYCAQIIAGTEKDFDLKIILTRQINESLDFGDWSFSRFNEYLDQIELTTEDKEEILGLQNKMTQFHSK